MGYEEIYRKAITEYTLANLDSAIKEIQKLKIQNSRLARENLKLRLHLNRCRKEDDYQNWLEQKKYMLNIQYMADRRQFYVRNLDNKLYAIWITDLDDFPCINFIFEVK